MEPTCSLSPHLTHACLRRLNMQSSFSGNHLLSHSVHWKQLREEVNIMIGGCLGAGVWMWSELCCCLLAVGYYSRDRHGSLNVVVS